MLLVVGAEGQLGRCLQNVLTQQNIDYVATSHQDLDVTDQDAIFNYISTNPIDTIVNCAAWTAVDDAEDHETDALRINFEGPRNLALAALHKKARLIHISTDYVFSGNATMPYTVDTPTAPLNAYGRTKLRGEEAVLDIGNGQFPIIRTAWLYSRYGRNFAKTIAFRAFQKQPVQVVNDQLGQPTMARDLAQLIVNATNTDTLPPIIHGTNSGLATWFDFASAIYEILECDASLVSPITSKDFPTKAKRPNYSVLDHSELVDTSMSEMRDWYLALQEEMPHILEHVKNEMR